MKKKPIWIVLFGWLIVFPENDESKDEKPNYHRQQGTVLLWLVIAATILLIATNGGNGW